MKLHIITLGIVMVGAANALALQPVRSSSITKPAQSQIAPQRSLLARVTVYWASGGGGSDRWTRQHQAATSVRLRAGHCAVDPRHIPYGSQVCFPDSTLLAVDTGKHVVSRKAARLAGRTASEKNALVIDRFFETKRQAEGWANSHPPFMTVQVVPPGSRVQAPPSPRAAIASPTASRLIASNSRASGTARATISLP